MTDTTMTCERLDAALAAYLEDELPLAARRAVDVHLGECLRCASLVRDIEEIRRQAARLPELAPSRDLWSGIAERIDAPVLTLSPVVQRRSSGREKWWLGLAAAGLVAVTAGVTYTITMQRAGLGSAPEPAVAATVDSAPSVVAADTVTPTTVPSTPTRTVAPQPRAANVASTAPATADVTLAREIVQLRAILAERQLVLDSATVAVLEHSLSTIDRAIAEARTALERDPASPFLNEQLNRALEKKLGLLRTVALLPARM